jgi:hypothetical protein
MGGLSGRFMTGTDWFELEERGGRDTLLEYSTADVLTRKASGLTIEGLRQSGNRINSVELCGI